MIVASLSYGYFDDARVSYLSLGERIVSLIRIIALRFTALVGAPL
jgi:hypothetical protein